MLKEYEYKSAGLKPKSEGGDKEAMHRMIDGEVLYTRGRCKVFASKDQNGKIHFVYQLDDNNELSIVEIAGLWDCVDEWLIRVEKSERDWREHIGDGTFCYVGDTPEQLYSKRVKALVVGYIKHIKTPYITLAGVGWMFAEPMPEDEADKMIWRG